MKIFVVILLLLAGTSIFAEASKNSKCPLCHNDSIRPIVYGHPEGDMWDKARRGEIILGGCCVSDGDPNYGCTFCRRELSPLLREIYDSVHEYQENNKLSDDFSCIYKPMKSEDISLPAMIVHGEPADFQFYFAKSYIELNLAMGWAYMEIPLASMYGVFPAETERYLSGSQAPISFYFLTSDAKKYKKMADYVLLMLYPQQYFKSLPPLGGYRLLHPGTLKTMVDLYEYLNSSIDANASLNEIEYKTRLQARIKESLTDHLKEMLFEKLKEFNFLHDWLAFEKRDKAGTLISWCETDLNIEFSIGKSGMRWERLFWKECRIGKSYSLYFFYSDAEAWGKYQKFWGELCEDITSQNGDKK